jgi:hypothetical protein
LELAGNEEPFSLEALRGVSFTSIAKRAKGSRFFSNARLP